MKKQIRNILGLCILAAVMVSFAFLLPPKAAADTTVITKILTTVQPTPVALMDPSQITVATSTEGCTILSAGWYDAAGNRVTSAFGTETYRLEITIGAMQGYTIAEDCKCYLNNSSISSLIRDGGKNAVLVREYTAAIWAPTVYKHPGSETVDEGGWASFVVSAQYARDYEWGLQDPSGRSFIPLDDVKGHFPGVETTGNGSHKIMIYHIPAAMNGWKVVCNFVGAGVGNKVPSNPATITVRGAAGRAAATANTLIASTLADGAEGADASLPAQAQGGLVDENGLPAQGGSTLNEPFTAAGTNAGTGTGTAAGADPAAAAGQAAAADPAKHVHVYSSTWSYDARGHWHECPDDGARADEELHNMSWTVSDEETGEETGRCSVCGYTAVRRPAASSTESGGKKIFGSNLSFPPTPLMWILCALVPVDILLVIIHGVRSGRRYEDEEY
jgi:hypothetical protein